MSATTPPTRTPYPDVRRTPAVPAARVPAQVAPVQAGPVHDPRLNDPRLNDPRLNDPRVTEARVAEADLRPNVLLPGVSHAGAVTLGAQLTRHPQLCPPVDGRVGLFTQVRYGRPIEVRPHDYDRYYATWSGQRYRVETSAHYFDGGRAMAEALARGLPDLRVILVLRDPAQRLWTGYLDKLARGRLPRAMSFEMFVDRCLALRANGVDRFEGNRHFRTVSSGFYIDFLPDWIEMFGPRLRVAFTEDLLEEPDEGLHALLRWLDLEPDELPEEAEMPPEYPMSQARPRRRWGFERAAARSDREVGGPSGRMPRQSDRTRARLRALYAGANAELASFLLGRGVTDLPRWLAKS